MASKRKNYAKCKVWGENVIAEMEGSILGCMESMLLMVPSEHRQAFINHLQQKVDTLQARAQEAAHGA
jgi:hypothetical protein